MIGYREHVRVSCLALVLVVLTASARAEDRVYKVTTPHYEIRTTISEDFAYLVGDHMESIYREYRSRLSNLFGGGETQRFQVFVYRTEEEYLEAVGGQMRGSAGIFIPRRKLLAGWLGDREPRQLFKVLYHEGFHQFVFFYISPHTPIWLNEGMAEYFSEATWMGTRFKIGEVAPVRIALLHQSYERGNQLPLKSIVTMSHQDWAMNVRGDSRTAALQYNQSWALVHFFIHGYRGRLRPRFVKYVKLIKDGKDAEKAFAHCFGSDFDKLERAFKKYVLQLKPSEKYVCEMHVEAICYIMRNEIERGTDPRDLDNIYQRLRKSEWRLSFTDGSTLSNQNGEGAEKLFHCPEDRGKGVSYQLKYDERTRLPQVICKHHRGMTIIGRLVKDPRSGALTVEIIEDIPTKSNRRRGS